MLKSTLYQCFKRQLKTATCFGSFLIHPQGVLNVLDWNYLWYFCVCIRCLAAWFFGPVLCVSGGTSRELLLFSTRRTRQFQSSTFSTPWGWITKDPKHVGVFNCLL